MYKRFIVVCTLATALLAGPVFAGGLIKRPDLTIFSALAVAQSPRAVAMGSAYATAADDINAIWFNPAGLTGIQRGEVSFSHTQWFVDSKFNVGAIAYSNGAHTLAVSVMSFKPEDVEETTILKPGGTGQTLSLGTTGFGVAYARKFTDKLSFGIRFMLAREDLHVTDFTTYNVDFGTKFHTGLRSLRLSMSLRNFGKDTEVQRRQFQQPLAFNLGAAGEVVGQQGDPFYVTGAFEMNFLINWEERYHVGGEAWLANILALRAGYMFRYDSFGVTAGAGLKVPLAGRKIMADVAWQETKNDLNAPLRLSVGFQF
jgi:long-subunit fatty acid transport protein